MFKGLFGGGDKIELKKDGDILSSIRDVVTKAKEQLLLVSPYIDPGAELVRQIADTAKRGVEVTVVFRKDKLEKYRDESWFRALADAGVVLMVVPNLHSKLYMNEERAVIASMNLLESSFRDSFELGFSFTADASFRDELDDYVDYLGRHWEEVQARPEKTKRAWNRAARSLGHCIRCSDEIRLNPKKPYCNEHYEKWAEFSNEDYEDKYCHQCGKKHAATMRKPLCSGCYAKAA